MIDWQSYEDGTMEASERARVQGLLQTSPETARDFEGFQRFRKAVRLAGTQELRPIPSVAQAKFRWWIPVGTASATMALAAVLFFTLVFDPMRLDAGPESSELSTSTTGTAVAFLRTETGMPVPALSLPRSCELVGARAGDRWGCLDLEVGGKPVFLYVSRNTPAIQSGRRTQIDGLTFWEGRGIGWESNGLAYYLKGAPESSLRSLAVQFQRETG